MPGAGRLAPGILRRGERRYEGLRVHPARTVGQAGQALAAADEGRRPGLVVGDVGVLYGQDAFKALGQHGQGDGVARGARDDEAHLRIGAQQFADQVGGVARGGVVAIGVHRALIGAHQGVHGFGRDARDIVGCKIAMNFHQSPQPHGLCSIAKRGWAAKCKLRMRDIFCVFAILRELGPGVDAGPLRPVQLRMPRTSSPATSVRR